MKSNFNSDQSAGYLKFISFALRTSEVFTCTLRSLQPNFGLTHSVCIAIKNRKKRA